MNIAQQQKLSLKLSPNQLQYLKLLQLPIMVLEQRIKEELEQNPLLEEEIDPELETTTEQEQKEDLTIEQLQEREKDDYSKKEDEYDWDELINDDTSGYKTYDFSDDENRNEFPQPALKTLTDHLSEQLHLLNLSEIEFLLGEEIIGNIDNDGYLRRSLDQIVQDINLTYLTSFTLDQAEQVLQQIQNFDPPGIGARNLQECLLTQLLLLQNSNPKIKDIAIRIIREYFDEFLKKHYDELLKKLLISSEELKETIELIQKLNPKPGEGEFTPSENYVIPDFYVHNLNGDLIISLNEKNIPPLRINKTYQEMIRNRKNKKIAPETREFIKNKFEAAKWFITCIYQRRQTMMKVMQAIVEKQKEFFLEGEEYLKPIIYKNIADTITMDISTISRTVRGKYVETDYGVFELKYFFSEKIERENGEEVSNKQIKSQIKNMINSEDPSKPMTDDEIVEILKEDGFNIARRTVAKYREQMSIPVARLRKKMM
jgi:RNA polymerase sigma-54 factor